MPISQFYFKRPFHTGIEFPWQLDSSASNVRKSFKLFKVINDFTYQNPDIYVPKVGFSSTTTVTSSAFTPVANVQYNGVSYPVTFTEFTNFWRGTTTGLTISRAINPDVYLGLKCTGGVGTFDYLRSFTASRLQNEGVLNDDGTGTDYSDGLMPYGAKATATVVGGTITACAVTAGGWNYTATANVYAVEVVGGVMYYKDIGTASVSGGAVQSISVTAGSPASSTPSGLAGWVNPEIRICFGRSGFTVSNAAFQSGFTACYMMARPTGNMISVAAAGDSIVDNKGQADILPTIEGYQGIYEIGVNGRAPVINAGIGSGTAQTFANFASNYPALIQLIQLAKPTRAILALGTNDIRNGRTAAQTTTDLTTITNFLRSMGMRVGVANVLPRTTSGSLTNPLDANFDVGGQVFTLNTNINNATVPNDLGVIDGRATFANPLNTVEWGGAYVTDGTHPRDAAFGVAAGTTFRGYFNRVVS